MSEPYIVTFNTLRSVPVNDTASLNGALQNALPGDEIALNPGSYVGQFNIARPGTATNPILLKANGHVIINGGFRITAEHNYVMGTEIADGNIEGVSLLKGHCGVINCVIHGQVGAVGIGAWNEGPRQVIYGNIVYGQTPNNNNPHNIYTQNNYATNGYKYFVNNVVIDPPNTGNTFNFHAYTEGNYISGMWVERNVFANGRFLIGGWNEPHYKEHVEENYFYKAGAQFGYKRPIQFEFINNYLGRCGIGDQWHWGDGEVQFPQLLTDPTVITGNTIVYPPKHWELVTSAYTVNGRQEGIPKLRSVDVSDNNRYIDTDGKFHGSLNAGGVFSATVTGLAAWQQLTQSNGGNLFDANSSEGSMEPSQSFYLPNEYDPEMGWLVVYNWQGDSNGLLNMSGMEIEIYDVKDIYGNPIVTGTDSVIVPLSGEFAVFLVRTTPATPTDPCKGLKDTIRTICNDATTTFQQRVRRIRKVVNE